MLSLAYAATSICRPCLLFFKCRYLLAYVLPSELLSVPAERAKAVEHSMRALCIRQLCCICMSTHLLCQGRPEESSPLSCLLAEIQQGVQVQSGPLRPHPHPDRGRRQHRGHPDADHRPGVQHHGRLPEAPQHGAPLLRHLPGARAPRLALAVPDAELAAHTWPHRWLCLALWILCL